MLFPPKAIRARLKRIPFQPVRFVTSSGMIHDVYHPDLVLVGANHLTIGLPTKDDPAFFDLEERVAIGHITDMKDLPLPPVPAGAMADADAGN